MNPTPLLTETKMSEYREDYFVAGAATAFGKPYEDITKEERSSFKRAFFQALTSDRFQSLQSDYLQAALKRQEQELCRMEKFAENLMCPACTKELTPCIPHEDHWVFWCLPCDKEWEWTIPEN